jgi:mono/diheme cytochrome c family protein
VRGLIAACLATATVAARPALSAEDPVNPLANDAEAAHRGEALFGQRCQPCHNTRGKGGKCPQLIRGAWGPGGANSDLTMYRVIAAGRPGTEMGGFGNSMSGDEIWQIVAFLRAEAKRAQAEAARHSGEDDLW